MTQLTPEKMTEKKLWTVMMTRKTTRFLRTHISDTSECTSFLFFQSGTYRGMLYGIVLRDYPKQVISLAKAKSVPANVRESLSWAQNITAWT